MNTMPLHSCSHCAMSELCLPLGVSRNELAMLEELVDSTRPFQAGESIFSQGTVFGKVYAVKSGAVKSVHLDEQGNEYVVGFHFPGELVGLDGIYPERYISSAIALDTTVMCELDYPKLSELCVQIPSLQKQLFRLLSRDIYESNMSQSENSDQTAEQKLANFLNNLSVRYEVRGFSDNQFPLTMARQDIANHLGMAPETISRLIKRFKDKEILSIKSNRIELHNIAELKKIAACQVG